MGWKKKEKERTSDLSAYDDPGCIILVPGILYVCTDYSYRLFVQTIRTHYSYRLFVDYGRDSCRC